MKVILFGATGMVGQGVLFECLDAPDVTEVLLIGRSSAKVSSHKVSEVLLPDLLDYSSLAGKLGGYDACFFCLGISSAGMSEADYTKITYGYTLAAARALVQANPKMTFIYVSGEGTDSTGKGGSMWARVKGKTENDLLALGFARAVMFRPAFIQPMRGITSRTTSYRVMYALMSPFTPLIKALIPGKSTTTEKLGRAMLQVARSGAPKPILHSTEINALAEAAAASAN